MSLLLWLLALLLNGDKGAPPHLPITGVHTRERALALTFDACATKEQANGFDQGIFDILAREKIPTTIYMTGTWAEKHPGAVKQIAAAEWVEIGNHSYSHARLTLLQPERLRAQIRYTNQILRNRLGRPALSLRPPAGAWNQEVMRAANRENLPVVLWSVVSGDAFGRIPADRIRRTVLEQAKPGSIIIFHINKRGPFTGKALPAIIAGLREKGFHFVTVSQLLALPDAVPITARPKQAGHRDAPAPKSPASAESGAGQASPALTPHPSHDAAPPAQDSAPPAPPRQPPAGDTHEDPPG
jgi:peptidoglycan/xylan/chitin deacetylase (PgdA/CDA1 family)